MLLICDIINMMYSIFVFLSNTVMYLPEGPEQTFFFYSVGLWSSINNINKKKFFAERDEGKL